MTFIICADRKRILDADNHVLVTGGPGCGKTTIALQKAFLRITEGLLPNQKVLFLSFSRAAVARIVQAAKETLPRGQRQNLEIQTFHSFCWNLVRGHGYLLGANSPIQLLPPHDERAIRHGSQDEDPEWDRERERLFIEEGRLVFDLFAPKALSILQGSLAHRKLVTGRYPLIVVDEAQDTGTDQWNCIEALAAHTQLVCLADLEQQIYDFRHDVSPERLSQILMALKPIKIDLGGQNNRSPGSEIVAFGNDILANTPRGSCYQGVSRLQFQPTAANRNSKIRAAIGLLRKRILETTGSMPESIGFFASWGKGVTIIAGALQGGDGVDEIRHRVVMDEAEVLLATRVVALCLEPIDDVGNTLATGLELISDLYRARGNSKKANQLSKNASDARNGRLRGNAKCPRSLKIIVEQLRSSTLSGNPAKDWMAIRKMFERSETTELTLVSKLVIYLLGFNRGRKISDALSETWKQHGEYRRARLLIESAISEDQIIGSDGDLKGINVMTIHKSKGKEFDGVVILHLGNNLSPLSPKYEKSPHLKSRRLLRVGITRAKHHVLLLTDAYSPCPLLVGHKL